MAYRIYADESGTHDEEGWLIIGMLFVPDHGPLHVDLCTKKDEIGYFNNSSRLNTKYREVHFSRTRGNSDVRIAKRWIDTFLQHKCFYRAIVIDWSTWDGSYFGNPFEPAALKKRKAYKKWAEMLLHPEVTNPGPTGEIRGAEFFLDRLRIMYGYDVIAHLEDRFSGNYDGPRPYIEKFQHTDSARDANQCLQLCDLLTGALYQALRPSTKPSKLEVRDYLENELKAHGVRELRPEFWKGFSPVSLRDHLPKFSAWFWQPTEEGKKRRNRKKKKRGRR